MRWLAQSLLLLCSACSTIQTGPALPVGEFYDHVLEPLAVKAAAERIDQAKAHVTAGKFSPELAAILGTFLAPGTGSAVGAGVASLANSSLDKKVALIETRRLPLQRELLELYIGRTKAVGSDYRVCVDGAERVYTVQDGRFVRLANGPGPCEVTNLQSLTVD